jgi:hypothetical protein
MIILRQKEFASVRLAKKATREYIKSVDANSKKAGFYKSVLDRNKLGLNNMYKNPKVVEKVTNPDPKVLKKYKKEIDKLSK